MCVVMHGKLLRAASVGPGPRRPLFVIPSNGGLSGTRRQSPKPLAYVRGASTSPRVRSFQPPLPLYDQCKEGCFMKKGRGKVEFEDVRRGVGPLATPEHKVCVSGTISLHRGERLSTMERIWIDLKRRHTIAGLRYGVEGMQAGGVRRIVVPPQLGYGEEGLQARGIPPNAMLIFEVELLDIQPTNPPPPKLRAARERKDQNTPE